ncbi:MAG TPA: hypothetical protein VGB85_30745 [Nannocystis sp.]|jgi:hypothetical protein
MPQPITPDRVSFKRDHLEIEADEGEYAVDQSLEIALPDPYGVVSATVTAVHGRTLHAMWELDHDAMVRGYFTPIIEDPGPTS